MNQTAKTTFIVLILALFSHSTFAQDKEAAKTLFGESPKEKNCADLTGQYQKCITGKMGATKNLNSAQEACAEYNLYLSVAGCGNGKESAYSPATCIDSLGNYETSKNKLKTACGGNSECNQNLQQCLANTGATTNLLSLASRSVASTQTQLATNSRACRDLKTEGEILDNLDEQNRDADQERKEAREKYLDANSEAQDALFDAQEKVMDLQKQLVEMQSGLQEAEKQIRDSDKAFRKRKIQAQADLTKAVKETQAARLALTQKLRGLQLQIKNVNENVTKKINVASANRLRDRSKTCRDKYVTGGGTTEYNRFVEAFTERQKSYDTALPVSGLGQHLAMSKKGQGNILENVRQVFIQRCIQESINPEEIKSIQEETDLALSDAQFQIKGIQAEIQNTQEQLAQMEEQIPNDLELVKADAQADVQSIQEDRDLAIKQYQQVQQQMQQMQTSIAQAQAQIPQKQQTAQQKIMEAGQNLQLAELRYNQINNQVSLMATGQQAQGSQRAVVPKGGLKALGDKVEKGLEAYGEMDANETKAYRACCFNGSPSATVSGFVDRTFCSQGKIKESTRNSGLKTR